MSPWVFDIIPQAVIVLVLNIEKWTQFYTSYDFRYGQNGSVRCSMFHVWAKPFDIYDSRIVDKYARY